jgi:hypothetical protein
MGQRVNGVLLLNYSKVLRYAPSILRNDLAAEDRCALLLSPIPFVLLFGISYRPLPDLSRPSGIAHSL